LRLIEAEYVRQDSRAKGRFSFYEEATRELCCCRTARKKKVKLNQGYTNEILENSKNGNLINVVGGYFSDQRFGE
jgi:hypothetical protein